MTTETAVNRGGDGGGDKCFSPNRDLGSGDGVQISTGIGILPSTGHILIGGSKSGFLPYLDQDNPDLNVFFQIRSY